MEFIRNNMFWIVGGLVLVGGISAGAYYINSTPDSETEFVIIPRDNENDLNLDIFDYDFPDYNWLENFPTEFEKLVPPTNNGKVNIPEPTPSPAITPPEETPWEQGPSEPLPVSKPPALPSSDGTPWTSGPSN